MLRCDRRGSMRNARAAAGWWVHERLQTKAFMGNRVLGSAFLFTQRGTIGHGNETSRSKIIGQST